MEQETLEEAGVAYAKTVNQNHTSHMLGFYNGAKWQQERMYSEEDMKFAYEQGVRLALISQSTLALHKGEFPTPKEWFEQFKNK
jgi:hypothetical protein